MGPTYDADTSTRLARQMAAAWAGGRHLPEQARGAGRSQPGERRSRGWCETPALRSADVGVRTVLLGWPPAVAVGQAVTDAGQVVLDPFGGRGGSVGVVVEDLSGGVDPLLLVAVEGLADGGVVNAGVVGGHVGAGVVNTRVIHHWVDQAGE